MDGINETCLYFAQAIMQINWLIKKFNDLRALEVYQILQLRNEVFVVEQNCVFQDADNKDQHCVHLLGYESEALCAYTRLVPKGIAYEDMISIGRVVTSKQVRKRGAGKMLMQQSIKECYQIFGRQPIKIGAQLYLKRFYESFGFVQSGKMYLEDGIEHIEMILH